MDDTIRKNIAFGESSEQINDEKVNEVIDSSGLRPLLNKNEQGINLVLGERGIRLSGGEKQRVGIARALYKNPKILILDEATSSLDTLTEREIIASVNKLKNKITIIIVTHRLNTVKNCEKILLLDNGRAIDFGSLDHLKNKYPDQF